ncbi:phosphorylase family protein [Leucobacter sp. GX24907]
MEILLVFAHRDEADAFGDVPHLVTGVGKVNAAAALAQALAAGRNVAGAAAMAPDLAAVGTASTAPDGVSASAKPSGQMQAPSQSGGVADPAQSAAESDTRYDRVIVLGTAGLVVDGPDAPTLDTVCQITGALQHDLSLPSPELRLDETLILPETPGARIATGDTFVQNDAQRHSIAADGATLVDMESYAYASVCRRFGVPLQIFKVPSDFADSATSGEDWDTIVHRKSAQLRRFWDEHLRV